MPWAAELFLPAAARLSIALVGALGLVLAAERHHLGELNSRTLFLRWRTWTITAPIFGAAVMGPKILAAAFVSAVSLQALREYAALTQLPSAFRRGLYAAGMASAPVALWSLTAWRALPPLLLIAATLTPLLAQDVRAGMRHLVYTGFGWAYVPWLLTYFVLVREHVPGGQAILLALGTAVAASDVFAFAFGKLMGRHPLASKLSPAKTIEGVVGNFVGAYAGFALMGFALPETLDPMVRWLLPIVVALGCVWGDLVESLVKRHFDVKDAGTCLPGFGGLLDRIDSLLFVLPLAYTLLVLWP